MFCLGCSALVPDGAQFCPVCGAPVKPIADAPISTNFPPPPIQLTTLNQIVMSHSKVSVGGPGFQRGGGALPSNIRFEDPEGQYLGEAVLEWQVHAKYTLLDDQRAVVLVLDAVRAHGLTYDFLIHDAGGAVLASMELKPASWVCDHGVDSSRWGPHYGIAVGGRDSLVVAANPTRSLIQLIELGSGTILASGTTKWAFTTARTEININETSPVDRRIVLGAFLRMAYE